MCDAWAAYDSVVNAPFSLSLKSMNRSQTELGWPTLRGFFDKLQSSTNLGQSFKDDPAGFVQALESSRVQNKTSPVGASSIV